MQVDEIRSSGLYSPGRKTARFVSSQPVTVALLKQHQPFAYGVVANISAGGACLMTDAESLSGRFLVRMSFYDAEIVEAEARVMWVDGYDLSDGKPVRHGIAFVDVSEGNAEKLKTILLSPTFLPMGASKVGR